MTQTQTFEPQNAAELSDILRRTLGDNLAIAPIGAGLQLGIGNLPEREDIAIATRALNRIVDYEPDDQVVVVEAGITLGELQAVLAQKKQRLAIDPLGGESMTIGGMLATNAYGPSAVRYGTLKDLIVGIEIVRADGAIARAGGKVVKNVAGFDVSKLMVGSLGTLAIITKATFRVHPLPESMQTLAFTMPVDQIFPYVLALRDAQLEPSALVARLDSGSATVEVTFEGFGPGVESQVKACEQIAGEAQRCHIERSGTRKSEGRVVEGQSKCRLKATYPPSELSNVAAGIDRATVFPMLGVIYIDLNLQHDGGPSTTAPATPTLGMTSIEDLRLTFETVTVESMPHEWYGKIDAWGQPPQSFPLMRALKDRFDPTRRLNPGRFLGGL